MTPIDKSRPQQTVKTAADEQREATRQQIRQQLKASRQALDSATVRANSHKIVTSILPLLGRAETIAAYLAFDAEVIVDELLAECRKQGRQTFVPLIQADHTMQFAPIDDDTVIRQNRYGIREPDLTTAPCLPATALDLVIVPLLGFDSRCNRMGMGGGYYDRTFAHRHPNQASARQPTTPLLIGVAHEQQRIDAVPSDWWDVPLDYVVTEQAIYPRQPLTTPTSENH